MKLKIVIVLFTLGLCACTQLKPVEVVSSPKDETSKPVILSSPKPDTVTASSPAPISSSSPIPNSSHNPSSKPSDIKFIEISDKASSIKKPINKHVVKVSSTKESNLTSNNASATGTTTALESQVEAPLNIENFIARASAKKQMRIKEQTLLKIWIGPKEAAPVLEESEASKEMSLGKKPLYAKVEPYVSRRDDVSIQAIASTEEKNQSICAPIPDTGTDFVFTMTPLRRVTFEAGGNVFLFDTEGCTGTPRATKAASLITVEVKATSFIEDMKDLWDFSWSKIQDSIKELVSFFMLILVISFRKRILKYFKIRKIPS